MSNTTARPKIVIDLSGGNIQSITSNCDIEIVTIDYDNANDEDFTADDARSMMSGYIQSGSDEEVNDALAEHKAALEDIVGETLNPAGPKLG